MLELYNLEIHQKKAGLDYHRLKTIVKRSVEQNHIAFNAWKRCRKRDDGQEGHCEGIHDGFLRDQENRDSQLKIGWTEQECIGMDKLTQEDHSYRLSKEEFKRYQGQWYLTVNKSGKNAPMRLRSDFRAPVTTKNRLRREPEPLHSSGTGTRPEAGGAYEKSIHFLKCLLQ